MSETGEFIPQPQIKARLDSLYKIFAMIGDDNYVFICDVKNDVSRWSRSAVDLFGLPSEYMKGAGAIWEQHIHPRDRAPFAKNIADIFAGKAQGHDLQYRAKMRDGRYVICTCRGAVFQGEKSGELFFGGAIRCLGVRQLYDVLTGYRNQYGFFFDLKTKITASHECCVMQVGFCDFSSVNNNYGYYFGNRVIQDLCARIRRLANKFACDLYHMDGSRFIIISNSANNENLREFYNKLCSEYRSFVNIDGKEIMLSLCAGMVIVNTFKVDVRTLYACLDYAFEESKSRRQGNLVVFDNIHDEKKRNKLEALSVIRSCIGHDFEGFELYYQPVVATKTGKISAVEALIRWSNEEFGRVPPDDFIPVLENDHLFPQLGRWILKQAIIDMQPLIKEIPDLLVHVNASYSQFESDSFLDDVSEVLQETGCDPRNLCIELTERCRLLDVRMLCTKLNALKNMGVKIALDDFGTGFSSMSSVRDLPIDIIKVDRAFVKDIETNNNARAIIDVISHFANVSNLDVCVEGVETSEMIKILKTYSVDSLQGYFYSKPVPVAEFMQIAHKLKSSPE